MSNSLSHSTLIELIDVTLAGQDAFSKVVEMFADVEVGVVESSDDSRVTLTAGQQLDNSTFAIWQQLAMLLGKHH